MIQKTQVCEGEVRNDQNRWIKSGETQHFGRAALHTVLGGVLAAGFGAMVFADPIYPNSVVSNDIDFIHSDDPSAYACFAYLGERRQEMPGHPSDELMANGVFTHEARFTDGTTVEVWVHYDVETEDATRVLVGQVGPRLGKLPTFMRNTLRHVVIHAGDAPAFAEHKRPFFRSV